MREIMKCKRVNALKKVPLAIFLSQADGEGVPLTNQKPNYRYFAYCYLANA